MESYLHEVFSTKKKTFGKNTQYLFILDARLTKKQETYEHVPSIVKEYARYLRHHKV